MIQFKKVIIHNFGSYGHAELELQNRGFCLVSGKNLYAKDNALSNGSGKSFLWSAICYAMTGETISGIKANLKNINTEDTDCFVQLDFVYNKDLYSLVRTASPKNDLKIYKNDIDLSGKGIRESEKKLLELLPDLTKDLIASTIIIGQGMPNKFSSFSPSGRKELLEKLTKSDFMVEDLKTRISARQTELGLKIRELEDSLLMNRTQLNSNVARIKTLKDTLLNQTRPDFDTLIADKLACINEADCTINQVNESISCLEHKLDEYNTRLLMLSDEKSKVSAEELAAYTESYTKLSSEKARSESTISSLKAEIKRLKSIVDTCPTCGQRMPNIHKPDTSAQEQQLNSALIELNDINVKISKCDQQHREYVSQINSAFNCEMAELSNYVSAAKREILDQKAKLGHSQTAKNSLEATLSKLQFDKQNWDKHFENQQNELVLLETEVAKLNNVITLINTSKDDFDRRMSIVKKMDSLIRRDFRGYLLTNIISYIDRRAKDYCSTVFGTKELSLQLNGNSLDITYCGKHFDGLSGGEKQRVDLILQLSIRDLLTSYLGLSANILVLDEVTDFLDKKSCQAVMQLLEKELKTVESVFIISHHSDELEIPVDSEIKVIKNEQGISELF